MARLTRSRTARILKALGRISISRVPQKDVVIYDAFSRRHLYPLLDMTRSVVFDLDFPRVNLWVLLGSLRYGRPSARSYLFSFLRKTQPKVVITTSDNSIDFYAIKTQFPHICVISIQNGRRNTFGPRPHSSFQSLLKMELNPPSADFYFTFGSTEQLQFEHLIHTKFVRHGNLKNNYLAHISSRRRNDRPVLSFISSFPNLSSGSPSSIDSDVPTHFFEDAAISFRSYFSPEGDIARFLMNYCKRHGIDFRVIGKRTSAQPEERAYFQEATGNRDIDVVPCDPEGASYLSLIDSDFVVSIDSTLAYEMFGRGKRTAFLTMRAAAIGIPDLHCPDFGFPEVREDSGPFWTNRNDEAEYIRVLDFVTTSHDDDWKYATRHVLEKVMNLDPDNAQLLEVLEGVGVSHGGGTEEVRRRAREVYGVS